MGEVERIEVRKIYVGRAAIFGLLYGLIFGVIIGVIMAVLIYTGVSDFTSIFGIPIGVSVGMSLLFFVLIVALFTLGSCLSFIISAAVYNLVVNMGGRLDVGLIEYEKKEENREGKQIITDNQNEDSM